MIENHGLGEGTGIAPIVITFAEIVTGLGILLFQQFAFDKNNSLFIPRYNCTKFNRVLLGSKS